MLTRSLSAPNALLTALGKKKAGRRQRRSSVRLAIIGIGSRGSKSPKDCVGRLRHQQKKNALQRHDNFFSSQHGRSMHAAGFALQ